MKRPSPEPTLPLDVPKKTRVEDKRDGVRWVRGLMRICKCGCYEENHPLCGCLKFEEEK